MVNALSSSVSLKKGFHALSDPLRLRILDTLHEQELCVCDLCDRLNVRQSKLSFHLKTLKESGLLNAKQQGKWVYYSVNFSQLAVLEQYLAAFRQTETATLPPRICADK